jgi:hypothetical protein
MAQFNGGRSLKSRDKNMKNLILTLAVGLFAVTAQADDLTTEEQALADKGATMEMYQPNEHSRHYLTSIRASGKAHEKETPEPVLCFVFGMEDAAPAREEGKSMAEFHYSRSQADQFLFAQGWDKYHDRFFTRAYVQEGLEAFDKASRRKSH